MCKYFIICEILETHAFLFIHKQVMNLNKAPAASVGLVGYLPVLEVSPTLKDTSAYKDCAHYLLQQCIGHVLTKIECKARYGFKAKVDGQERILFPRLGAMTLDTKERVKYFGLRSDRTCGFCRLRYGRSVTRKSTRHDADVMKLMFTWAKREDCNQVQISQRSKARKSLARHGWMYKRECLLNHFARHCLVHIPQFGKVPYAGLIHFDRMHTFFLNFCTYLMESLVPLVIDPVKVSTVVKRCHQFRDPHTGQTHPRLYSIMKMTHYTAEKRVRAIFYWAHVLGVHAEVITPNCNMRLHAQTAVATLQLLLIATRGHRAFTKTELDTIFIDVGTEFFRNLEKIAAYLERVRIHNVNIAMKRNPRIRPPVPFKAPNRHVLYEQTYRIRTFSAYVKYFPHAIYCTHMCKFFNACAKYFPHVYIAITHA